MLFRTNETALVQTKCKLLDDGNLWCIVSLPSSTFVNAGAGVKANLLLFTRGGPTEHVWHYDLSDIKGGKKTPLAVARSDRSQRAGGRRRARYVAAEYALRKLT